MHLSFETLPASRALHHRFAFELLPRQFFKQTILLWPVLREVSIGQKSIEEIWKMAVVMHKDLEYIEVEGLKLLYRDQPLLEVLEIQLPPIEYFPEATAVYLSYHPTTKRYRYFVYIPEGDLAHWLEVDQNLEKRLVATHGMKEPLARLSELLGMIE